tara:strand:- start:443 stop:1036 length:594 start_codon:yes stop_codon:yes gene_type:complete
MYKIIQSVFDRVITSFFWRYARFQFNSNKVKFGSHFIVKGLVVLNAHENSTVIIGDNCTIKSGFGTNPLSRNIKCSITTENNAKIQIGHNTGISSSCIWAHDSITIGSNVNIGADSIIIDSDAHSLNFDDRRNYVVDQEQKNNAPIVIGNDVFIGTRCIILKGVNIGARSVVGSGSVVLSDIEPDSIYGGNPARKIR